MVQRDLIKDQIEQLGRVIGRIIAIFAGYKSKGQIDKGVELSNGQFKSQLGVDIPELATLSKQEVIEYLEEKTYSQIISKSYLNI